MAKKPPCIELEATMITRITVDKHDPKLCWSDYGPHGSRSHCSHLYYGHKRRGLEMEQWCNLFPGSRIERIDTPTEPKFARCQSCIKLFGLKRDEDDYLVPKPKSDS
jgi:hypothetical protein